MKRSRGIDLVKGRDGITYLGPVEDPISTTFDDLPEWHTLGGYCSRCEREAWVDRWAVQRKWGKSTYLGTLALKLRCLGCGNKSGNKWILGQLPR